MLPENNNYYFLKGGGEMGQLIREKDWAQTPLGPPSQWPSSLRTMVSVMLDNPFGMYIAWGKEYTQIYNDGYRPILGTTKHPQALGISTWETFSEIWHIIESMFAGVMNGEPVGFPDFMLPLNRNGFVEICYFDFSYSPIRMENGEVGGILVTVIETTNKKKAQEELKESETQLQFAIEAAQLATFDYNLLTKKLSGNSRLKDWFGVNGDSHLNLEDALEVIAAHDRERVKEAIAKSTLFESGGRYDEEYTIIHPVSKRHMHVHAKGKVWFNEEKVAYRFNGTLQDVTEQTLARRKTENALSDLEIYKLVIDNITDFIAIWDFDFLPFYVNKQGLESVGLQSLEQLQDTPLQEFFFPEDVDYIKSTFLPSVVERGANECEIRFRHFLSGEPMWMIFSVILVKNSKGNPIGYATISKNITEQKSAEEKIRISESNLKMMILQAPVAIAILRGPHYVVEIANKYALELWGRTEEQVAHQAIFEAMPELIEQGIKELLDDVCTTGNRFATTELPVQIVRKGTLETLYINFSYDPLYNAEGNIDGIMAIGFDVTQQVSARQAVEANEEKLNMVINASDLGIWEYDLKTEESIASERCLEILGFPKGENLSHRQLVANFHPDDLAIRKQAFEKSYITGLLHYETRVIWSDQSLHWLEVKGKVFYDAESQPDRLLGTLRDVTPERHFQQELLEREQKFRLLADSMPQHIWTSDPEGNLNYFNRSVFSYSGLSYEQIMKDGWIQIVHPDDREANIMQWKHCITTGQDYLFEHRFRKYNGEYRWQLSRAIPQKDDNGKIKMWVGTSTDIQEQKMFATELEKQVSERTSELKEKNIELENMNKELQSFAYISSHDLQEPLRKIQTFASQIIEKESKNLSEFGREKFIRMQSASKRMQTLIQDLLAYSRTNTQERIFEKTSLNEIVEEVKEDLAEELLKKQAIIETGDLGEANIIPLQFGQLMFNLINNALKFSADQRQPHIKITSEINQGEKFGNPKLVPGKSYCQIRIADNGIGFEPEYSEKIFEVFQRLHGKEKYKGTGIGLAIVKKIVENHHGVITASSILDQGATFDIYLPA